MAKSNKDIVLEVLRRSFVEHDPTVVAEYFGANYRQHNPVIADGPSTIAKMIPTLTGLTYQNLAWRSRMATLSWFTGGTPAGDQSRWSPSTSSASRTAKWWNTGM